MPKKKSTEQESFSKKISSLKKTGAQAVRKAKIKAAKEVTKARRKIVRSVKKVTPTKAVSSPIKPRLTGNVALNQDPVSLKFMLTQPTQVEPPPPFIPEFEDLGELPPDYGSKRVFLVARDPYWLYAYWDVSLPQFREALEQSCDGKIFLQLYTAHGERVQQIQIPEGVRNWFIYLNNPGGSFYTELGYYNRTGCFHVIGQSSRITAPRDYVSPNTTAQFVTIPFHFSFRELLEMIGGHMRPGEELAEALLRLQQEGFKFPFDVQSEGELDEKQKHLLGDYFTGELVRRSNMGSFEWSEIIRRRLHQQLSSGIPSLFSPMGASFITNRDRSFFMHVNAELIIYGGTDPRAQLRIDGQDIPLKEDGTFSYHFSFPDGRFHIPIEAKSPDGEEHRSALLSFLRISEYAGGVKKTRQSNRIQEPIGRRP